MLDIIHANTRGRFHSISFPARPATASCLAPYCALRTQTEHRQGRQANCGPAWRCRREIRWKRERNERKKDEAIYQSPSLSFGMRVDTRYLGIWESNYGLAIGPSRSLRLFLGFFRGGCLRVASWIVNQPIGVGDAPTNGDSVQGKRAVTC